MGWQAYLKCFWVTILFYESSYCDRCTPFTAPNIASINGSLLTSLLKPVRNSIPVFNNSTVPNLDSIIADFNAGSSNEDIHLNTTQLLTKYEYPNELHEVTTSDGYILKLIHIPGNGKVIFLMHGLLCSSDDFLIAGPKAGLAYLLADLGYDVWMGNARGNVYSRRHKTLSPDCAEFWDFSWHEISIYDVTAMIDYILEQTNQEQIVYIGHSQGTTNFFVMASELPEYNDKISLMIALSAVVFLGHSASPILTLIGPISNPAYLVLQAFGMYEMVPRNQITNAVTSIACGTPELATVFCNNLVSILFGFDYAQVNAINLPVIYGHYPAGSATKQLVHYGQEIVSGKFRQFDKGLVGNIEAYNSATPPDYPLEKVTSRVVIFHAPNDVMSTPPDREILYSKLPNVVEKYGVPFAQFTHTDFLYAKDVRTLVYDKVAKILKKYV